MCRVLGVAPSGYYAWLEQPVSNRAQEDARLLRLIRASFVASHGIYGAPRVFLDLREAGETCSKHRVARLMRAANLRALHGYRTRRWSVGKPSVLIPNLLQRQFTVTRPNKAWVTDITYIRTSQGWLYLAVVMDLFSRMIAGWAAGPIIHRELVLNEPRAGERRLGRLHRYLLQSDAPPQLSRRAESRPIRGGSQTAPTASPLNPGNSIVRMNGYQFLMQGRDQHNPHVTVLLSGLSKIQQTVNQLQEQEQSGMCVS